MSFARIVMRSARLPGVNEPVFSAMPSSLAPSMVASSTSRFGLSFYGAPRRCQSDHINARMTLKKSALVAAEESIDSPSCVSIASSS